MVRIPLKNSRLLQTGEVILQAKVELLIRSATGSFAPLEFSVDSGANLTTIAVSHAREAGLMVPARTIAMAVNTAAGTVVQQVHPGRIAVKVPGIDGTFTWPCHFVEHGPGMDPFPLLGLSGVLDDMRLTFDGTYSMDARYGVLLLEPVATQ